MMKRFFALIFISILGCKSTELDKKVNKIDEKGYLVGILTKNDLEKEPFATWFLPKYTDYMPDEAIISEIKKHSWEGITIQGVLGTWCGDSKRETPRLYKILEATDFDMKNLKLIGVNRSLVSLNNEQAGLEVKRVPTFIFYKNGKEIGRFVEYAVESLEADILSILKEEGYKNPYEE